MSAMSSPSDSVKGRSSFGDVEFRRLTPRWPIEHGAGVGAVIPSCDDLPTLRVERGEPLELRFARKPNVVIIDAVPIGAKRPRVRMIRPTGRSLELKDAENTVITLTAIYARYQVTYGACFRA
jgi:hypothetical protein